MLMSVMQTTLEPVQRDVRIAAAKKKILLAAEGVMLQKGFADSSISEIARTANVTDSAIYLYFKNKQDLLFSVLAEKLQEQLVLLKEHLEGIPDHLGQLRKLMWIQLRYHDLHRGYARLLLLECRSFKAFYSSSVYETLREYARTITSIVTRGAGEAAFRGDVSAKLIRDVILGVLDLETISSITSGEIASAVSDFEDIVDLVDAMVAPREPQGRRLTRMEAILEGAKKVFSQRDFSRATISEIAGLAGVADATIYEYFQNKEDILLSLAANQLSSYLDQAATAFDITDPERKLRRLIKYHFFCFLKDLEFLKLFLMSLQVNSRFYGSRGFEVFRSYGQLIEGVIEEGKTKGIFRASVNPRVFRNMFLGSFVHMCVRWFIVQENARVDKVREIEQVTELLVSAVLSKPEARRTRQG
jgi:TetR/AcrR family fatty acid metabolism transcriptional regulator